MDALPIMDRKNVAYSSKIPNKAHLCGHDGHTAILLGAARLLSETGLPRGNVKLVFQPAEENKGGGRMMVEEGVLLNPKVDTALALHVSPLLNAGHIGVCPGDSSANSDQFTLIIQGKGGHAAHPHTAVDAIVVAAQLITALQQIPSRMIDPLSPVVVTIGKINGGYARNVIAPEVKLEGTVRTNDLATRASVRSKIEQMAAGICSASGADFSFKYIEGYPTVYNNPALLPLLESTAKQLLGEQNFHHVKPTMGGEDFSYYGQKVPAFMFRLGIRNEAKQCVYPMHNPLFDLDEDALPVGAAMLEQCAQNYLEEK